MRRITHCCVDIRGALRWPAKQLKFLLRHPDGRGMTADEVREALLDELAKGREVLPVGDPCEGFDYKTGCPGHETPDEPDDQPEPDHLTTVGRHLGRNPPGGEPGT